MVNRSDNPNICWEWNKGKDKDGYGQLAYATVYYKTHRLSYELAYGPIPKGMHVLHSCDNPSCVNPNHLSIGTDADNMADKIKRWRHVDWDKKVFKGKTKLTPEQVLSIRNLYQAGNYTQDKLSKMFGCGPSVISEIVNRKAWKHI